MILIYSVQSLFASLECGHDHFDHTPFDWTLSFLGPLASLRALGFGSLGTLGLASMNFGQNLFGERGHLFILVGKKSSFRQK